MSNWFVFANFDELLSPVSFHPKIQHFPTNLYLHSFIPIKVKRGLVFTIRGQEYFISYLFYFADQLE